MKVLKFGGTSVGSAERIKNVAALVSPRGKNIVVLSAMAGTTNTLVEVCDYLYKKNNAGARDTVNDLENRYKLVMGQLFADSEEATGTRRSAAVSAAARQAHEEAAACVRRCFAYIRSLMAVEFTDTDEKEILAQGELISSALMTAYLKMKGIKAVLLPALKFMRTDDNGEPDFKYIAVRLKRLLDMNADADLYITQGFICRNAYGDIDNLQRGGSDYTATIIGAALDVEEVEIWTDIDGMHNNDPRYVAGTRPVARLHFEEAAELAYFGAKILHPSCVLPARLHNIPIRLLNTMQPDAPGTVIENVAPDGNIKAVAAKDDIVAIHIKSGRMFMAYSFLLKVFEIFERHCTPVHLIATSEVGVSVAVDKSPRLSAVVDDLKQFGTVTCDDSMCIICVAGDLEWHNTGAETKALSALDRIAVRMISYGGSNYNIAFVVRSADKITALKALSTTLFTE